MADLTGFYPTFASEMECCVTDTGADSLERIAKALEIDVVVRIGLDRLQRTAKSGNLWGV
ncbi:hypothetical protein AFA_17265 [Alcaligenes faecalis]|uniref:Uncharacterized protein n=1 Tax=Alcaligenes faecalis TaxID=511 RepID=A0AB33CYR7_ALCFA|nr:hypothetical protein AFA_17265 [Alcaligenes faecalis]